MSIKAKAIAECMIVLEERILSMKFLNWVFSIRSRHKAAVNRYENGGFSKIFSFIVTLMFIALSFVTQYFFLSYFHKPGVDIYQLGEHALIVIALGVVAAAITLATLDYILCFIYVGIRTAIIGDYSGGSRIGDLVLTVLQLVCGVAFVAATYFLAMNYKAWFL